MRGEITLRGRVMPIGGLKEKVLAAHRAGMKRIIAPVENRNDLLEMPRNIRRDLEFIWVETMDQVLEAILDPAVPEEAPAVVPADAQDGATGPADSPAPHADVTPATQPNLQPSA